MTRKDIALTVGGILATMTLAYLFYKLQQRDAAATAAAAQAASDAANAAGGSSLAAIDPTAEQYYQEAAYAQSLPSISIPNLGSSVDTSASTATTGITSTGTSASSTTDPNNLISQIIADYAGNNTTNPNILPTISLSDPIAAAVANIPISAQQAAATLSTASSGSGVTAGTTTATLTAQSSNSSVTSHPVTAHPIVTTGT
jgi:hypothetical protein